MLQESLKQEKWDKGRTFLLKNKYEFVLGIMEFDKELERQTCNKESAQAVGWRVGETDESTIKRKTKNTRR